jgi:tetratricopeptide (TPR) repeat protein
MRVPLPLIFAIAVVVAVISLTLFPRPEQIGEALEKGGRLDEALTYYQKALDANPFDEPTWVRVASTYQLRGQPDESIAVYKRLTEMDPNDVGYRRALAQFQEWSLLIDDSIVQKAKVAELEPRDVAVRQELANYYVLNKKDYPTAIRYAQGIVATRPDDAEALQDLARLYSINKQIPEAIATYQRALEADPGNPSISRNLARVQAWQRQGELREEIVRLRRAVQAAPDDRSQLNRLLEILRQAGQTVEAERLEKEIAPPPAPGVAPAPEAEE